MRKRITKVAYEAITKENDTVFETVTLPYPMIESDGIHFTMMEQDDIVRYIKFNTI